ncbi:MAG: PQQ-dependent sugar dehydrogenase [Solirubrobacterales bacterium]
MAGTCRVRRRALAAGLFAALAIAFAPSAGTAGGGTLKLRKVAGFDSPVYAENAPGAPRLLFVVEQGGTISVARRNRKLARPFLDISELVSFGGEEGLLGLAFDPGYKRNRRFYVYYVTNGGDLRVDSFKRKRRSDTRASRSSRRRVIAISHPTASNHNGGQLAFGPDGFLYLGPGDGGGNGDPEGDAQDPESLLGKILRIDPKRTRGYRSPDSNPFAGRPGRDEIYALGLRNPYRFSFDAANGDLSIGDVGQSAWEEIDHASLARARGANFGWDLLEGTHAFEGDPANPPPDYVGPIHEYENAGGTCAVTGGYVVRDRTLPSLRGRYVYGDFCAGDVRSLDPGAQNPSASDASIALQVESLSGFGEGFRNRLYAVSLDGPVYRIVQR